jgi:tryptophanyl-tRNA synthetase
MAKKIALSGIQPSGVIHLGNYLGAISQWVKSQKDYQNIFSIVDLHAITVPQDPTTLRQKTYEMLAIYLASGIDPRRSIIFVQSHVPAHTELAWILNTVTTMGELNRMTQFKDKAGSKQDSVSVGLFDYPVLMAADILLYDADFVPVGEDQKQHVELARDIAGRFNNRFGKTFVIPEPVIRKTGARIMGLDNPENKMSKSAESEYNYIALTDQPEIIRKKIMKAVTDSGTTVLFDKNRKGLYNLLTIYQILSGKTEAQIEKQYTGKGFGVVKADLADLIINHLSPIQKKIAIYMKDTKKLDKILADGAKRAEKIANKKLSKVKKKVGFVV